MELLPLLKEEFANEYAITKKFIALFPDENIDFAPHEKSMKLRSLAGHVVEIYGWPKTILTTEVLDFGKGEYTPTVLNSRAELLAKLETEYKRGMDALNQISEEDLTGGWRMEYSGQLLASFTKYTALRHTLNQQTHHRAQLGVYYRLLDIALPGTYGPSADQANF